MTASGYNEMERDAALRFLQTAVVVDDAATMNPEADTTMNPEARKGGGSKGDFGPAKIAPPGMAATVRSLDEQADGSGDGPPPVPVNVKVISSALADEGITCGILRPTPDESESQIEGRVVKACSRADLVVLDWVLDSGRSFTSRGAIAKIIKEDQRGSRVIAVYTSEEALEQIANELLKAIPGSRRTAGADMMIRTGGTRIALFRKSPGGAKTVRRKKAYSEERLAERIIEIFVEAVQGWVRAIALHGMAAVRENVHHVLTRLDPVLDMGYAANLMRIEHLEDGPQQILDSIGGEFGSVIHDDARSRQIAGGEAFGAWAERRATQGKMAVPGEGFRRWAEATDGDRAGARSHLIDEMKSRGALAKDAKESGFRRKLTRLFFEDFDVTEAEKADFAFAMLLSLRFLYGDARRTLHLGTVLQHKKNKGFWLCVQPVCDSVRLGEGAGFPLLRLKSGKPDKKPQVCFPVRSGNETVMLSSSAKADEIEVVRFDPDPTLKRVVFDKPTSSDNRHTIKSVDGVSYVWLAELKTAHSNRVAHKVGEQLARVGLDESVWLSELS